MQPLIKLAALLSVPIIAIMGVLAILPDAWTHDATGELSGLGFWLAFGILLVLAAIVHAAWTGRDKPPD
jgi:succinate dehydrogenase hydrophobic anchor subunit